MATVAEMPATYEVRGGTEPMAAASQPGEPVTPLMRACQQDDLEQVQSILTKHVSGALSRDRCMLTLAESGDSPRIDWMAD